MKKNQTDHKTAALPNNYGRNEHPGSYLGLCIQQRSNMFAVNFSAHDTDNTQPNKFKKSSVPFHSLGLPVHPIISISAVSLQIWININIYILNVLITAQHFKTSAWSAVREYWWPQKYMQRDNFYLSLSATMNLMQPVCFQEPTQGIYFPQMPTIYYGQSSQGTYGIIKGMLPCHWHITPHLHLHGTAQLM